MKKKIHQNAGRNEVLQACLGRLLKSRKTTPVMRDALTWYIEYIYQKTFPPRKKAKTA